MADPDDAARLGEIEKRCEKATAGPWAETHSVQFGTGLWGANKRLLFRAAHGLEDSRTGHDGSTQWQRDTAFVRTSRSDIPYLLGIAREALALRAEVEKLRAVAEAARRVQRAWLTLETAGDWSEPRLSAEALDAALAALPNETRGEGGGK